MALARENGPLSPSRNGQIGVLRRHVVRPAARDGSAHGPISEISVKTYQGFPQGMPTTQADTISADLLTTQADTISADLLAFVQS